jgi:hypothetical protein
MVWEWVRETDQHVPCSWLGHFGVGWPYPVTLEIHAISPLLLEFAKMRKPFLRHYRALKRIAFNGDAVITIRHGAVIP